MKNRTALLSYAALAFMLLLVLLLLFWNGAMQLNNPSKEKYPIRGVDVSSYQGEIDWEILAGQDIDFAFIKATEGSSFVDPYFAYNYEQAKKTSLRVGAYHFFSYDSLGKTQAENFIKTVEKHENMLPPVIDVEFYGDKAKNLPEQSAVREQLSDFIQELELYYGMKPILYATEKSYKLYIAGGYDACDIWIRNVLTTPSLSDHRAWTFWQYSDRTILDGYAGKEKFIDMNVFFGTKAEFNSFGREMQATVKGEPK